MQAEQRDCQDRHRHSEASSENPHDAKHSMSLEDVHAKWMEDLNNKVRSGRTRNRRRCGMAREVIGRIYRLQRALNPLTSRPFHHHCHQNEPVIGPTPCHCSDPSLPWLSSSTKMILLLALLLFAGDQDKYRRREIPRPMRTS